MPAPPLLRMFWSGDALVPASDYWQVQAAAHFGKREGEIVWIVEQDEPSDRSRNHYFAVLADAHANLPPDMAKLYPTPEHLRAMALILCGHFNPQPPIICETDAEAQRLATYVRSREAFSVVHLNGNVVQVLTAKSQSARAMGSAMFQKSKQDVFEFVADLLGVTVEELTQHAGQAA